MQRNRILRLALLATLSGQGLACPHPDTIRTVSPSGVVLVEEVGCREGTLLVREGTFSKRDSLGRPWIREEYQGGLRDGASRLWYPDGIQLMELQQYSKGVRNGVHRRWDPSGNLVLEEHFQDGLRSGPFLSWSRQGHFRSEASFSAGAMDGAAREYAGSTLIKESIYRGGLLHGIQTTYDSSGSLQERRPFLMGLPHGNDTAWWSNGLLRWVLPFRNGALDGESRSWYPEGGLQSRIGWRNGRKNGDETLFERNGSPRSQRSYASGACIRGCP